MDIINISFKYERLCNFWYGCESLDHQLKVCHMQDESYDEEDVDNLPFGCGDTTKKVLFTKTVVQKPL